MTATISRGTTSDTKVFYVEVPQLPPYVIDGLTFGDGGYQPKPGGTLNAILLEKNTQQGGTSDKLAVTISNGGRMEYVKLCDIADGEIQLNLALPADGNPVVKAYIWDMETLQPLSYSWETANDNKEGSPVTIYMCGDSTMENVNLAAKVGKTEEELQMMQTGWGEVLQKQFDENYVKVNNNYSKGGKSSKSFYDEGRLHSILEQIQPGDYLFIQFGHNDSKKNEAQNFTSLGEAGTYRQYLTRYVEGARSRGAIPVLVTSIYRRMFSGGVALNSGAGYPEEMIALARQLNVPLLNMHARSGEWLTQLGEAASAQYYMFSVNGTDNSHLTYPGANEIAKLANGEIARVGLPIAKYLKPLS